MWTKRHLSRWGGSFRVEKGRKIGSRRSEQTRHSSSTRPATEKASDFPPSGGGKSNQIQIGANQMFVELAAGGASVRYKCRGCFGKEICFVVGKNSSSPQGSRQTHRGAMRKWLDGDATDGSVTSVRIHLQSRRKKQHGPNRTNPRPPVVPTFLHRFHSNSWTCVRSLRSWGVWRHESGGLWRCCVPCTAVWAPDSRLGIASSTCSRIGHTELPSSGVTVANNISSFCFKSRVHFESVFLRFKWTSGSRQTPTWKLGNETYARNKSVS